MTRYFSDSCVKEIEKEVYVPFVYVMILSKLLQIDLWVEANLQKALFEIPEKYFQPRKNTRKYSNFQSIFQPVNVFGMTKQ